MSLNDIVPGKRVGKFELGMPSSQLLQSLSDYRKEQRISCFVVWTEHIGFWIDESSLTVTQILVRGNYPGKVLGKVGIGDTLADVEKSFGKVIYEPYTWEIQGFPGVAFELSQNDIYEDWDERDIPIETICVFSSLTSTKLSQ